MNRRAFTLLEMMIVVTIISVLAGMLMPAVVRVRAEARATSCRNQLGNIGKATLMYSINNADRLPSASELLIATNSGTQFFGFYAGPDEPVDFSRGYLSLWVDGSKGVWQCPVFIPGQFVPRAVGPCTGYAYNYHYLTELVEHGDWWDPDYKCWYVGKSASVILKSTTTVLFGDSGRNWMGPLQENWFWTPPSQGLPWGSAYTHFRHRGRANVAWADGHVSSLEPDPVVELDDDGFGVICDTNDAYFDPAQ